MTRPALVQAAPLHTMCKWCGAVAELFGVVDFNKQGKPGLLPMSGIPIFYHRCPRCGFIFSLAFDHFTPQDFLTYIYNEAYTVIDPEFVEIRPADNARIMLQLFANHRGVSILDYGGGNGALEKKLRAAGFSDVVTYDPFSPAFATRPERQFDVIVSFEVVEHSTRPRETFADMNSLLKPEGLIVFSTLLQPADMATAGLTWWYVGPRNGHVSLFTSAALQWVLGAQGLQVSSCSQNLHFARRQIQGNAPGVIRI